MRKMSFKKSHEYHRKMWDWLARTGNRTEGKWPEFKKLVSWPYNMCFACEYVSNISDSTDCESCPITWGSAHCEDKGTYYHKWCKAKTIKEGKKYAALIRDMEWKRR